MPDLKKKERALTMVVLAHGASGTAASMRPYVEALRARGVDSRAIDLPRHGRTPVKAERAVPAFIQASTSSEPVVAGGQSYGGRVASLAALETRFAGLVLISYPLHRPGHPESLRTEHWPRLDLPVLVLSGTADPFARVDLLRREVKKLPRAELVTFPGIGHGLVSVADEAMEQVAAFVRDLVPARR